MVETKQSATKTIHIERLVAAPVRAAVLPFRSTRALSRWWDPSATLSRFAVGGTVAATDLPGYEIVAIVPDRLIAQRYTSIIDGMGLWSFVAEGRKTRVILDHNAAGNVDDEAGRTFYWQGLIENLAAMAEGRPLPFVNGAYVDKALPKGVRHRTMDAFVRAWKPRRA